MSPKNTSLLEAAATARRAGVSPKAVRSVMRATLDQPLPTRRAAAALLARKAAPALDEDDDDAPDSDDEPALDEGVPPPMKKKAKKAKPASSAALAERVDALEHQAERDAERAADATTDPDLMRQVEAFTGASTPRQARTARERARLLSDVQGPTPEGIDRGLLANIEADAQRGK
jgi:hypothetical protein